MANLTDSNAKLFCTRRPSIHCASSSETLQWIHWPSLNVTSLLLYSSYQSGSPAIEPRHGFPSWSWCGWIGGVRWIPVGGPASYHEPFEPDFELQRLDGSFTEPNGMFLPENRDAIAQGPIIYTMRLRMMATVYHLPGPCEHDFMGTMLDGQGHRYRFPWSPCFYYTRKQLQALANGAFLAIEVHQSTWILVNCRADESERIGLVIFRQDGRRCVECEQSSPLVPRSLQRKHTHDPC